MERRRESPRTDGSPNADEAEETPRSGRPRSRQDNVVVRSSGGTGTRKNLNRGENMRSRRRTSDDEKISSHSPSKKTTKNSPRQARRMQKLVGVSSSSKAISRRSVRRRKTRGSVNQTRYRGAMEDEGKETEKEEEEEGDEDWEKEVVPAIPKRVFKALHLLRHEKFLRVASRYLKPKKAAKKF